MLGGRWAYRSCHGRQSLCPAAAVAWPIWRNHLVRMWHLFRAGGGASPCGGSRIWRRRARSTRWGVCCRASISVRSMSITLRCCVTVRSMRRTSSLMAAAPTELMMWMASCRKKTMRRSDGIFGDGDESDATLRCDNAQNYLMPGICDSFAVDVEAQLSNTLQGSRFLRLTSVSVRCDSAPRSQCHNTCSRPIGKVKCLAM